MALRFEDEKAPLGVERVSMSEIPSNLANRDGQCNISRVAVAVKETSVTARLTRFSGRLAGFLTLAAVLASTALLFFDAAPQGARFFKLASSFAPKAWALLSHRPLSALPLLLAGFSYFSLQFVLRPRGFELLKRLMLGSAFVLWGIDQLISPGTLGTDLGDLVISLYVLDLGLMIKTEIRGTR
jgi:hypothetical protein